MKKALLFALLLLAGPFFIAGCFTYRECTFNVPIHASLLDLPFVKPATPTPTQTPQK